jgi:hypothetical protein
MSIFLPEMTSGDPVHTTAPPPLQQSHENTYRWATVTQASPLRIRLDGDTSALPVTPSSLVASLSVNDRVWVQLFGRRLIVLGKASGGSASSPAVQFSPTDQTILSVTATTATAVGARGGAGTFVAVTDSVQVVNNARIKAPSDGVPVVADFEIRQGDVIGSGTVVRATNSDYSWINYNAQFISGSVTLVVDGLTAGETYNIRQTAYVSSGTGSYRSGWLIVGPP